MKVEWDGNVLEGNYIFCAVSNSISIAGILKLAPELVAMNDGLFEVMLVKYPTDPMQFTRMIMALRSSDMSCDMIDFLNVREIRITTEKDVEWTLDGERGECGREFEIINCHNGIQLMLHNPAEPEKSEEEDEFESEDQLPD
jgi:diacylglycerol kinase family enzyme